MRRFDISKTPIGELVRELDRRGDKNIIYRRQIRQQQRTIEVLKKRLLEKTIANGPPVATAFGGKSAADLYYENIKLAERARWAEESLREYTAAAAYEPEDTYSARAGGGLFTEEDLAEMDREDAEEEARKVN